jgi:O-antigen ligase
VPLTFSPARWFGEGRGSQRRDLAVVIAASLLGLPIAARFGYLRPSLGIGVMCAAALLASHRSTAFVVLAFFAPFDSYIRPLAIYSDFLVADLFGFAFIVATWRQWKWTIEVESILAVGALVVLGAFFVAGLGPSYWVGAIDNVLRFAYFVVLVLMLAQPIRPEIMKRVAMAIVAGTLLRFAYEARAFFSNPNFVLHPSYQFGVMTSNPNTLAGFGAAVIPLACSLILASRAWWGRIAAAAAAILLIGGIAISFSKGAWVSVGAALAVWSYYVPRARRISPRLVARVAVAGLLLVLVTPGLRRIPGLMVDRWTSRSSALSNAQRLLYVETAVSFIRAHPVTGVGLTQFGATYRAERNTSLGPDDPHNAYLAIAAELGIPALTVYVVFLLLVTVSALRSASRGDVFGPALLSTVTALLFFQLFSAEPLSSRLFWILSGLALAPLSAATADVPESSET